MSASLSVVSLYDSNIRDPSATLRRIADGIEAGSYGDVGEVAIVLLGDRCEVFSCGPASDPSTAVMLLQAGAHRMIAAIAKHGWEE